MSADKQTFALHCEAKNDKVRKRLDIKGGFFWTEARKLSVAVSRCIAAMDDAGYDEDEKILPVKDHLISQPGKPALQHFIHRCILSR
ncbi:hypothetical protein ACFEA9_000875 [Escherichia coli]